MTRRIKLTPAANTASAKIIKGKKALACKKKKAGKIIITKKTVKPRFAARRAKIRKIVVKKIEKNSSKTAKPTLSQAQVVLESIAQEKIDEAVDNTENKDAADEIYAGETVENNENKNNENIEDRGEPGYGATKEIAGEKQEQELIDNQETEGKSRSLGLYRKIALSFIVLTVMLLAVVAYFSFVKVTIILTPNQERVSSNLIIDVFDQDKRSAISEGEILGVVNQIEVEQRKTYPATDIEIISEEVIGKVVLINNYNKNQPLVATTRLLSSDNKLFRIKKTVNVPAGGQLEVKVYADEPGQDMIIGPAHFTIPGLWAGLQDKIYGESKEPMKYSRQVKKYIKQDDIDKAVNDLKQSLLDKATTEVSENYQIYDQVIYDIDNNSISRQVDGKVGDEVEEFTITMKTLVTAVAFMDDEIYKLASQKLIAILPDDKQLSDFSKDDISYSLNNYNIAQGAASLDISFSGNMIIKQASSMVDREKLTGLNQQQLSDYLDNLPEVASHEIKFYPSFIKKAPSLVDRIELIIMNNE